MVATSATKVASIDIGQNVSQPIYYKDTFLADDTDNHDFRINARGKSNLLISVDNTSDQELTVSIWGAPDGTAEVGDSDVSQIGTTLTLYATTSGKRIVGEVFPFYIVRASFAISPNGTTISVFVNAHNNSSTIVLDPASFVSLGDEQLTVSNVSVAFASLPSGAKRAYIRVRGANIFMAQDGNAASITNGIQIDDGAFMDFTDGHYDFSLFRFIRAAATDATLDILYFE